MLVFFFSVSVVSSLGRPTNILFISVRGWLKIEAALKRRGREEIDKRALLLSLVLHIRRVSQQHDKLLLATCSNSQWVGFFVSSQLPIGDLQHIRHF